MTFLHIFKSNYFSFYRLLKYKYQICQKLHLPRYPNPLCFQVHLRHLFSDFRFDPSLHPFSDKVRLSNVSSVGRKTFDPEFAFPLPRTFQKVKSEQTGLLRNFEFCFQAHRNYLFLLVGVLKIVNWNFCRVAQENLHRLIFNWDFSSGKIVIINFEFIKKIRLVEKMTSQNCDLANYLNGLLKIRTFLAIIFCSDRSA